MKNRKRRRLRFIILSLGIALIGGGIAAVFAFQPEYAYMPKADNVLNPAAITAKSRTDQDVRVYDVWGKTVKTNGTVQAQASADGKNELSPGQGAVEINEALLRLGRKSFYKETFGNEVFLTDIMGIVDGPLTLPKIAKAIVKLQGKGTSNLQVELDKSVKIGNKTYKKGDLIDTGIDVPKGAYAPLGMPVKFSGGKLKVGISCAVCHATVDAKTKQVVEGAPNADLNAGLLLAMATNSAAYFTHTDVGNLSRYLQDMSKGTVPTSDGKTTTLPDPKKLEADVDETLAKWPRGNFDSTIDLKSNPAQIPDSFTKDAHPYGWSGFAIAGPFKGLGTFSNNVHAQNSDSLAQSEVSSALFGIDKELYMGTILQNAANPKFRYRPQSGQKPSEFFAKVDPTPGVPGTNELIKLPSYPKLSLIAPDGLFASSPGYHVGEQVNAMSAWQNTIVPPPALISGKPGVLDEGRAVFVKEKCITCHSGSAYTNHKIIDVRTIKTEPSRARAMKATESIFGRASIYAPDTLVPVKKNAKVLKVPAAHLDPKQVKMSFAHGESQGGYKVKGLIGLYWTAPYLHDGGVAVGRNEQIELGIPGTLQQGIAPDPFNSLKALVDRGLRKKVVAANRADAKLRDVHVRGAGHEFWVDEKAGFTKKQQDALIRYLLSLVPKR
ncbi:electron transport protein [Paenibacillus sp. MSJ-34]|uniref:electron transport protein n=1 Tax=Paenibacillus sp. MSJ-34 TaxID=2841529 RepID=UPI001C0FDD55|nr:electron transport protein [Paenibacillus sp. MSJ-34]MBU5442329.1 electron transport protein [Paenibacillus sp. MSJ-34]